MKQVFCKYKDAFAPIVIGAGTGHEACAQCNLPEQHPEFWDSHQRTVKVTKTKQGLADEELAMAGTESPWHKHYSPYVG